MMTDPQESEINLALRSCPFCGKIEGLRHSTGELKENGRPTGELIFYVGCCDCGISGPLGMTRRQSIQLWNKRNS